LRRVVEIIFVISLLLVTVSFGGAIHGIGDSLAVFRFWLALVLVGAAVLLMAGRHGLFAAILASVAVSATPTAMRLMATPSSGPLAYSIYQKNLFYKNEQDDAVIADIKAMQSDFVTLQEVFYRNQIVFDALAEEYQTSLICRFAGVGSIAVLSRWPAIEGQTICTEERGLAAVQVTTPAGPVWIVSVHLHWPYPHSQPEQVASLVPLLEALDRPVVVAGDFNMVPWSHSVRSISAASRAKRAGPVVRTLIHPTWILRLPIDHVLVPDGIGALETRPLLGSDHLGVLMRFDL
jgi:endonuclease/exonuclease/phosphatase (EEP) superfamily protein YafD